MEIFHAATRGLLPHPWKRAILACLLLTGSAWGFRVMPSLNTFRKAKVEGAMDRVGELRADGVWFITKNSDLTDEEWRTVFVKLGGPCFSEDNPGMNQSYADYVRIMGAMPTASFCYNETGGLPGGTLLSNDQIDALYESHGRKPIICLTRSYGGEWRTQTDRCLTNRKVGGLCMEYVKKALLENINAPAGAIKAARRLSKPVFLLMHAGGEGWTLAENKAILDNLDRWCPDEMASDEVFVVYQFYKSATQGWFGPEGVKAAIRQAQAMPNYSLKKK